MDSGQVVIGQRYRVADTLPGHSPPSVAGKIVKVVAALLSRNFRVFNEEAGGFAIINARWLKKLET